jgi:predicted permease
MLKILRPVRILRKHWKLTAVAIFSLSIAMALGVISLSITNTFLLLPPAGAEPDRLVMIYAHTPGDDTAHVSYPDYKYFRENNHVFTDIAGTPDAIGVQATSDGVREVKVTSRPVSDNYFSVMGVRPFLGRFYSPGEDTTKSPIAVLTYAGWKRLGSDPNIVGKTVASFTIIGVAPKELTGTLVGLNGDILTPLATALDPAWFNERDKRRLVLTARLKPGVTKSQAQADMAALTKQLALAYPKEDKDLATFVTRATLLEPSAIPDAELACAILIGLVTLVLLIACANVANLLLAIAVGRRQEAAIKLALGAQRGRLIRDFLRESAVICGAGAVIGYLIASALIRRYADVSIELPMLGTYAVGLNLRLDTTVAAFTGGLMLIATVATGIAPALYASSPHLAEILSGEIVVGGTRKNLRRNVLLMAQVAVCTLVLVGMGLCQRSLYNLHHADLGFSARNLVAVNAYPPTGTSADRSKQFFDTLRDRISALPGVESVTLAKELPLLLGYNDIPVQMPENQSKTSAGATIVDSDYFATFGIPMAAGRAFNSGDREGGLDVVVINRKMAQTLWPGQEALGRVLTAGDPLTKSTVVGITEDTKYGSVDEEPKALVYYALSQHPQPGITMIAKTKSDPRFLVQSISQTVRAVGMGAPFSPVTFHDWVDFNLLVQRILAVGVSALSTLGLVMALLGLFGAISYSVNERKKELGIRVALGATRRQLLEMVVRQTLKVTGAGVAVGLLLGIVATTLLRSQFYGINAVEWTVLLPVSAGMLGVSALVAYLSARPWIAVDPMEAVRHA